ncbi:hypothetical protein N7466_008958 [Penicillium verhagenii]|uniref:uncharacterized protein n=1 Tax=Penicillium verhagenii TaxID=1562060 RepID=UPI0025458629|nr:uncharacterized protein N7466_008958 [Penicillium verhagenii]KAJ5924771.1 hypothetical protein N7466_008958 [Penicillium verhagenii]
MLREWKYDSVLRNSSLWRVDGKLESFMTRAGNLIEANAGCMQDVIRTLAQEEGLAIIRFLLESRFETTFASQFIPLLRAITPDNVFRSYILEMDLGTIYKSMFGIDGSRASTTLEKIHNFLVKNVAENTCISQLEVSLLFFSRILDLNSTALIQQSLHDLAKKFDELLVTVKNEHGIDQLHQSFANMARVQRRLQVGNMIPTASSVTTNSKDSQMPSADKPKGPGGRHDNDHADICNIDIMPSFEEIASIQPEYLPAMNPAQWHLGGFDGLLDRNFRLLREDTVGQLRDAIHHFIYKPSSEPSKNDLRNNVYRNATVEKCCLSSLTRLELEVNFPQPAPAAVLATAARAAWWQDSRRLRPGNLVCLVTQKLTKILFCTVSEMRSPSSATGERGESPGIGLWKRQKVASIVLVLVEHKDTQVRTALELYEGTGIDLSLIEFPHVLLPSFEPTLKALQSMKRNAAMPFPGLFLPKQAGSSDSSESMPPLYSLQPGFNYDIASLMRDGKEFLVHPFKPVDLQRLKDGSDMDHAQAEALVHCLQHRISLIQGPPGTGKSYTGVALIKALLNGIDRRETCLGPILCVTFTNHALDQLLESLLNNKVTSKIVRIGGRSQSDKMTSLSLRNVSKDLEKTKMEKSAIAEVRGTLARHQTSFDNIHIGKEIPFDELVGFLRIYYPHHYNQLFEYGDRDGDQEPSSAILTWKDSGLKSKDEPRTLETLQRANLTNMSHSERQILHDHWVEEIWQSANAEAVHVVKSHAQAKVRFTGIQDEVNLRCLHEAKVVGATTTGLARRLKMVQNLQCKVIICEEAGEVLEPQLLTALLPEVEHLILIGDHQQLPPHVQSYDLSRDNHQNGWKYSLDVSLFERLVNSNPNRMGCGLPFKMLEMQRRMHPSIAQLVRDTSYPNIEDHPDVYNYPEVPGIKKRLFWFDHRKLEGGLSNGSEVSTSCWNEFEVDMIAALVHHLTQQGTYHEQDIAVLTPYLGQLHRLTQRLRGSAVLALNERDQEELKKAGFEDIEDNSAIVKTPLSKVLRLSTVDNFQGEEAKVVVISLVRSNLALNCGFLRSSQRNNVLLSRAQHGMYLIGNSETFGQIDMWAHVQRLLRQGNNIGPKLELQCPRHPETPIVVSKPEDFLKFSPEGGCHLKAVILIFSTALLCASSLAIGREKDVIMNASACVVNNAPTSACSWSNQKIAGSDAVIVPKRVCLAGKIKIPRVFNFVLRMSKRQLLAAATQLPLNATWT